MKQSQILWHNLVLPNKNDWHQWIARYTNGNKVEDSDDSVLFHNTAWNKAIRITYEPESNFEFEFFMSYFNDNEVEILNIRTNNIPIAEQKLVQTITDWLNATLFNQ